MARLFSNHNFFLLSFSGEFFECPESLEVLHARLKQPGLVEVSLLMAEVWNWMGFKVPSNPKQSENLGFYDLLVFEMFET